jgi:hypothetical protein
MILFYFIMTLFPFLNRVIFALMIFLSLLRLCLLLLLGLDLLYLLEVGLLYYKDISSMNRLVYYVNLNQLN